MPQTQATMTVRTVSDIASIVDIQLRLLQERLAERKLTVTLTPAAREYLALKGFDPAYGARPLKRLIQREVQDALAMRLLAGEIREGDTLEIDLDGGGGGLAFRVMSQSPMTDATTS